jgi:hypothetical protein
LTHEFACQVAALIFLLSQPSNGTKAEPEFISHQILMAPASQDPATALFMTSSSRS